MSIFNISLGVLIILINSVVSKSYYVRIARAEDPEHTFNMLGPAQFYDYDIIHQNNPQQAFPTSESSRHHNERESFKFMEAPVSLSNPVWNMFSKMSDIYRWVKRIRRSDPDVY